MRWTSVFRLSGIHPEVARRVQMQTQCDQVRFRSNGVYGLRELCSVFITDNFKKSRYAVWWLALLSSERTCMRSKRRRRSNPCSRKPTTLLAARPGARWEKWRQRISRSPTAGRLQASWCFCHTPAVGVTWSRTLTYPPPSPNQRSSASTSWTPYHLNLCR